MRIEKKKKLEIEEAEKKEKIDLNKLQEKYGDQQIKELRELLVAILPALDCAQPLVLSIRPDTPAKFCRSTNTGFTYDSKLVRDEITRVLGLPGK